MLKKMIIGPILILSAGPVGTEPATAAAAPLIMTCHPLLNGEPFEDATIYLLKGDYLFTKAAGQTLTISVTGKPLFLSRDNNHGVPGWSWADHTRTGTTVIRRVYWKTGNGPRRLVSTEKYDFQKQTVIKSGMRGDTCHHGGR